MSRVKRFKKIGEVSFAKSQRAKNIIIRVKPLKGITVSVPLKTSFKQAENFVIEKQDWILNALRKVENHKKHRTRFTEETVFKTRFRTLKIFWQELEQFNAELKPSILEIYLPKILKIESDEAQNFIKEAIIFTLRQEAKIYLPQKTLELAEIFNFKVNRIFIKNAKTRWGSCSSKNNINLNLNLLRLPQNLIDYVILHELSHTVHHNHSKSFWDLLNQITSNQAKSLDKELKNYRIEF